MGDTCFVVDAEPEVVGSGASVEIRYWRNTDLAECAENTAVDDPHGNGLDADIIDMVREHVAHLLPPPLTAVSTRFSSAYSQSMDCTRSSS